MHCRIRTPTCTPICTSSTHRCHAHDNEVTHATPLVPDAHHTVRACRGHTGTRHCSPPFSPFPSRPAFLPLPFPSPLCSAFPSCDRRCLSSIFFPRCCGMAGGRRKRARDSSGTFLMCFAYYLYHNRHTLPPRRTMVMDSFDVAKYSVTCDPFVLACTCTAASSIFFPGPNCSHTVRMVFRYRD